jgi:ATP-dependent 26S proteasome regulatory subunit
MPRTPRPEDIDSSLLTPLLTTGDGALALPQKLEFLRTNRAGSPQRAALADEYLLSHLLQFRESVQHLEETHAKLQSMVEQLTAAPWYPALFLGLVDTGLGTSAVVLYHGAERVVSVADDVDAASLAVGEEVFLGHELNAIVATSPRGLPRCGETATVDRLTANGRCILRWRDEEVLVDLATRLAGVEITGGDRVRWDRSAWLALEKVEGGSAQPYMLTEYPDVDRSQIGGQDDALDQLSSALTAVLVDPERASRYGQSGRQTALLIGPPGVGKTLMARVAVTEISRLSDRPCQFAVVKPGEWQSPWVGETEQNIRRCFRALRQAATRGPAVLFLDEIEAISRIRGGAVGHHADLALSAFLTEVQGFAPRDGVAIICATNRKDLVDPAVLERLSDVEIAVRRPDMRAARAIFDIHLPASLPFQDGGDDVRAALVDAAVSRFYSPNAEGSQLCRLHFRSGAARVVAARELMSGRIIEQICRAMCRTAFWRDVNGGAVGIGMTDLDAAVADTLERLRTTLTPRNAHAYLDDLPQDNDVVRVESLVSRVARPHRYQRAA